MKRWKVIVLALAFAVLAIGPALPDPVGHAFGRQWDSHIGWACAFWLLSFTGFDYLRRKGKLDALEGWWAYIVPGVCAWLAVIVREMTDLDRIIHGGLSDPAWKSYFDISIWGLFIAIWAWLIYRAVPRLHEVNEQIQARRMRKGKLP